MTPQFSMAGVLTLESKKHPKLNTKLCVCVAYVHFSTEGGTIFPKVSQRVPGTKQKKDQLPQDPLLQTEMYVFLPLFTCLLFLSRQLATTDRGHGN